MDQRQQQPFGPAYRDLARKTAGQAYVVQVHEAGHAGERVRRQAHVGVDEDEQFVAGGFGEAGAGVLLAAPTGWQHAAG